MAVAFEDLSPDQVAAVEAAVEWFGTRRAHTDAFRIFGAAGTGKTLVAKFIVERLGTTIQALAPTNRAAKILRGRGVPTAKTIHSVLFSPYPWCVTNGHKVDSSCVNLESKHEHKLRFQRKLDPPEGVKCFMVDEASMVDEYIGQQMARFGIPTLAVGDPFQLPPVGGPCAYGDWLPGVTLTNSHRFAEMSEIGVLANLIRTSTSLSQWHKKLPYAEFAEYANFDLILAWRNDTRWMINQLLRRIGGQDLKVPEVGDRLVSVANTYEAGVLNGDELTVVGPPTETTHMGAWNIPTAEAGVVTAWKCAFANHQGEKEAAVWARRRDTDICALTWSRCMTVHKAQGGEWPRVLIVDDLSQMGHVPGVDVKTWAYTAVTRASEKVCFMKPASLPTGMALSRMMAQAAAAEVAA